MRRHRHFTLGRCMVFANMTFEIWRNSERPRVVRVGPRRVEGCQELARRPRKGNAWRIIKARKLKLETRRRGWLEYHFKFFAREKMLA